MTADRLGMPLTARQRQVLRAVWETGNAYRAAERLGMPYHTAKTHLQGARMRLGVRTTIEALRLSGITN